MGQVKNLNLRFQTETSFSAAASLSGSCSMMYCCLIRMFSHILLVMIASRTGRLWCCRLFS